MEISHPKTTLFITCLALLGSAFFLWRTFHSPDNQINASPFEGLGQGMAEECAKTIQDRGSLVAVITAEHNQPDTPAHVLWESFRHEMEKHKAITLTTESVTFDPNDPMPGAGCPISAFENILKNHGQANAIVFFMALPAWSWLQEKGAVPASVTCKMIAVDRTELRPKHHYSGYFENGILSGLILMRRERGPEQVINPKSPREWFNNEYQIFTPQNYESLPDNPDIPPPDQR